jgi:hypothetical protein
VRTDFYIYRGALGSQRSIYPTHRQTRHILRALLAGWLKKKKEMLKSVVLHHAATFYLPRFLDGAQFFTRICTCEVYGVIFLGQSQNELLVLRKLGLISGDF